MAAKKADVIRRYARSELKTLWKDLRDGDDAGFAAGKAFEFFILRSFQLDGAEVVWPFEVRSMLASTPTSHQIDGVIYSEGLAALLECKHWTTAIDYHEIAYLRAHLTRRPAATLGLVFGLQGFTPPALELVALSGSSQILLWERDDIDWAVKKPMRFTNGLRTKYRRAVEHAMPDYRLNLPGGAV